MEHPADAGVIEAICLEMITQEELGQESRNYFEKLLLDSFVFRRVNGKTVNKEEYLDGLGPQGRVFVPPGVDVINFGDMAVASLVIGIGEAKYRNIRIFIRDNDGDWKLQMWCNSMESK